MCCLAFWRGRASTLQVCIRRLPVCSSDCSRPCGRGWDPVALFGDDAVETCSNFCAAYADALDSAAQHSTACVNRARREALSPAEALIEALHPWVAYAIMPLFALANAGVRLEGLAFRNINPQCLSRKLGGAPVRQAIGVFAIAC